MTDPAHSRAAWQRLTPGQQDAVVRLAVLNLAAVPDLAVAVARRLRGRRGVQIGPAIAVLGLAAAAPPLGRWARAHPGRPGGLAVSGLAAAVLAVPVAGAAVPTTVVGDADPLWALAVSAGARVGLAGLFAASVVRHGRRRISAG
jgi:hypothetical protein